MSDEELYSLVEIADLLGTPSTTIRYRARLFSEFLEPLRRPKQFRGVRYPASDLPVFQLVDQLYKQERSTGDIRRSLEEARDGKVIDVDLPPAGRSAPPALMSNGPETVARIIREGIAQAMAPLGDSNRKIAESLDSLRDLMSSRERSGADGETGSRDVAELGRRVAEMERNSAGLRELDRLRDRVRLLEDENRRLRGELEQARRPLPLRLVSRARGLF